MAMITNSNSAKRPAWKEYEDSAHHRLIANVQAMEKSGKDHCAFTMPGDIYCLSFDIGIEGVAEKFRARGKKIKYEDFGIEGTDGSQQAIADAADKIWKRFTEFYRDAIRSGSTVVDTGTEMWELLRLARFGKLTQVMPHHYGPVNAEMRNLIREAYDFENNVCFLHKMKDEWINYTDSTGKEKGKKTGNKAYVGFNDIPFLVQANIQLWTEEQTFKAMFLDCRHTPDVKGVELDVTGSYEHWSMFGQMLFPNSTEDEWV